MVTPGKTKTTASFHIPQFLGGTTDIAGEGFVMNIQPHSVFSQLVLTFVWAI